MSQAVMTYTPTLPHGVIRVSGEDAARFLQGQCSCDIEALGPTEAKYGTCNTPKGRMVSLFRVQRDGADFLLRMHETLIDSTLAHLNKYAVFFKCELAHDTTLQCYGALTDAASAPALEPDTWQAISQSRSTNPETASLERLPGDLPLLVYTSRTPPAEIADKAALTEWLLQACKAGLPELCAATQEQFILQHLNLQELDGVSFTKGCYTGQEIIARMKYLGKLKKRMFVFTGHVTLEEPSRYSPGSTIYDADGNKAGELVQLQGSNASGWAMQAVCDTALTEDPQPRFLDDQGRLALTLPA